MTARPNILLITSDQQHWNTLGLDNPEVSTPNLDRLARRGVLFTRAYCPNPTCTPTRASIITGKYPSQHGAWSLGTKLPEDEPTVGQMLSKAGYRTALVGKAHFQQLESTEEFPSLESYPIMQDLDFWRRFHGPFYGFDHVELARNHADEGHVGQHYALWMEEKGYTDWREAFRAPGGSAGRQQHRWNIPEEYHYDTWIAERSCALMDDYTATGEPFFLWSSFFDPHPPYLVPEPWDTMVDPDALAVPELTEGEHARNPTHFQLTQTENPDFSFWRDEPGGHGCHGCSSHLHDRNALEKNVAVYYGMISLMDKTIGRILDKLDDLGIADNTLVVFTTDHGHFFGHHGLTAKGPFHYEDMVRVPFIASMPGRMDEGARSAALQSLVDLAPTFLEAADVDVPRTMTGVSQWGVWRGESASARNHVTVEHHHQPTVLHLETYIDERYKISVYRGSEEGELFDLVADPGEVNNLWTDPDAADLKRRLLLKLIHAKMAKEPVWMPRVAGA